MRTPALVQEIVEPLRVSEFNLIRVAGVEQFGGRPWSLGDRAVGLAHLFCPGGR